VACVACVCVCVCVSGCSRGSTGVRRWCVSVWIDCADWPDGSLGQKIVKSLRSAFSVGRSKPRHARRIRLANKKEAIKRGRKNKGRKKKEEKKREKKKGEKKMEGIWPNIKILKKNLELQSRATFDSEEFFANKKDQPWIHDVNFHNSCGTGIDNIAHWTQHRGDQKSTLFFCQKNFKSFQQFCFFEAYVDLKVIQSSTPMSFTLHSKSAIGIYLFLLIGFELASAKEC